MKAITKAYEAEMEVGEMEIEDILLDMSVEIDIDNIMLICEDIWTSKVCESYGLTTWLYFSFLFLQWNMGERDRRQDTKNLSKNFFGNFSDQNHSIVSMYSYC